MQPKIMSFLIVNRGSYLAFHIKKNAFVHKPLHACIGNKDIIITPFLNYIHTMYIYMYYKENSRQILGDVIKKSLPSVCMC